MEYTVLSSGSRQNAQLIRHGSSLILVDCGMSFKKLKTLIQSVGEKMQNLRAVLITHDHLDHIRGLEGLAKRYKIPVFAHPKIHYRFVKYSNFPLFSVYPEKPIKIDGIQISSRIVSHDATINQAFRIEHKRKSLIIMTDMGYFSSELKDWASNPDFLAIESNYDEKMLRESFYPDRLKKRVAGRKGHLSNQQSLEAVRSISGEKTRKLCLLHLSENNNRPELVRELFETGGLDPELEIFIAKRRQPIDWMEI